MFSQKNFSDGGGGLHWKGRRRSWPKGVPGQRVRRGQRGDGQKEGRGTWLKREDPKKGTDSWRGGKWYFLGKGWVGWNLIWGECDAHLLTLSLAHWFQQRNGGSRQHALMNHKGGFANWKRRRRRERRRRISPCGAQSSPDTNVFLLFWTKFYPYFDNFLEKSADKMKANITNKEKKIFLASNLKILWCKRSHRVRFYIYVHAHVFACNLRNLPIVSKCSVRENICSNDFPACQKSDVWKRRKGIPQNMTCSPQQKRPFRVRRDFYCFRAISGKRCSSSPSLA